MKGLGEPTQMFFEGNVDVIGTMRTEASSTGILDAPDMMRYSRELKTCSPVGLVTHPFICQILTEYSQNSVHVNKSIL